MSVPDKCPQRPLIQSSRRGVRFEVNPKNPGVLIVQSSSSRWYRDPSYFQCSCDILRNLFWRTGHIFCSWFESQDLMHWSDEGLVGKIAVHTSSPSQVQVLGSRRREVWTFRLIKNNDPTRITVFYRLIRSLNNTTLSTRYPNQHTWFSMFLELIVGNAGS